MTTITIKFRLSGADAADLQRVARQAGMTANACAKSLIETMLADDRAAHEPRPRRHDESVNA